MVPRSRILTIWTSTAYILEPPELVLGLDKQDFYVWSTAGNERRNGPDDIDVCLYSLRKWAGLAAKGNPTALHFLFSRDYARSRNLGSRILKSREVFLSRQAALQFRGFADAQVRRLQGIGTGKKGQRHELIGVHGYDIKAAMHVIRLLNEGIELMRSGTITLPRPEKELLITIRTGNYGSLERVLNLANSLFRELEEAEAEERIAGEGGQNQNLGTRERDVSEILGQLSGNAGATPAMTTALSSCRASRTRPHLGLRYAGVPSAIASAADLLSRGERRVCNTNSTGLEHERRRLGLCRIRDPIRGDRFVSRQFQAAYRGIGHTRRISGFPPNSFRRSMLRFKGSSTLKRPIFGDGFKGFVPDSFGLKEGDVVSSSSPWRRRGITAAWILSARFRNRKAVFELLVLGEIRLHSPWNRRRRKECNHCKLREAWDFNHIEMPLPACH